MMTYNFFRDLPTFHRLLTDMYVLFRALNRHVRAILDPFFVSVVFYLRSLAYLESEYFSAPCLSCPLSRQSLAISPGLSQEKYFCCTCTSICVILRMTSSI